MEGLPYLLLLFCRQVIRGSWSYGCRTIILGLILPPLINQQNELLAFIFSQSVAP
ncbi:TPA: hypothetical protein RRH58_005507 [Klebsiella pneumoniae]|nr:hypothetical protein [Klebsiella pneumoniae]HDY8728371.1 hypothetical protein [Klebsiella pneumoniae]